MRGHVEVVRLLFVERDFRDRTMTPLHVACASGQVAVALELVEERGVDVNARGPMGRTALHWASMRGHTALVAWLVEMGADEGALDGDGRSPAQVMARRPNCALIEPPLASVRDHP
jgi:ankyrin repeat protein